MFIIIINFFVQTNIYLNIIYSLPAVVLKMNTAESVKPVNTAKLRIHKSDEKCVFSPSESNENSWANDGAAGSLRSENRLCDMFPA